MLVRVPASVLSYQIRKNCRSPSPKAQIAPPTKNAHMQSCTTGEGGDARFTISSYCLGFSFTVHTSLQISRGAPACAPGKPTFFHK